MLQLRLIGPLDHNFAWGAVSLDPCVPPPQGLLGAVASVGTGPNGQYRLVRDPLGINKLFWSTADDAILVAARPHRLVGQGCAFESIRAIPSGTVVDLDVHRGDARVSRLALGDTQPVAAGAETTDPVAALATKIRGRLDRFVAALAQAYQGTQAFVCLSGGLDSTGIAVLARDHFSDLIAVSFDLRRGNGYASEDRRMAERLAQDLGIPLLCVTVTEDDVLAVLDTVLVEGIDWRDFNVHAALVNGCLARGIVAAPANGRGAGVRRLVLTGDLPNEFLVDYQAETYAGRVYYRLPRLKPDALRAILVRGLETSHREVGPFEAWGLPVVQPYAAAADLFMALPAQFLEAGDPKQRLYRLVFGTRIPDYVYSRGKTRAQVGDGDGSSGVLAICADRGRDDQWLRRRFAELHGVREVGALDHFIRGGRYRCGIPLPEEKPV